MEIIKNKHGEDRAVIRVNFNKVRVIGQSKSVRKKRNRIGETVVYNFDLGPNFNVGGTFQFEKMRWRVNKINELYNQYDVKEIALEVSPVY